MEEKPDFRVHNYTEKKIDNALVILSFPTIGMISNIAANFLIKNLELQRIGAIVSDQLQPAAIIHEGVPTPPIRIFAGEHVCGPNGVCDQIVVITTDFSVEKKLLGPLAEMIINWCKENNCEVITTIEGINNEEMDLGGKAKVYFTSSNELAKSYMKDIDAEHLENGMVSGLSGVLLYKGNLVDYPVTSLLAEANRNLPDSRSAASVLEALNQMVPKIEMDPKPLLKQAEEIEEEIRLALSQIRQSDEKGQIGKATQGLYA